MTDIECWVNGLPGATVSVSDRALQYGDGLFETIRIRDFRPEFLECHLSRLMRGCERLGFPVMDWDALKQELLERASRHQQAVLKIILSRGSGGRGYRAAPGQTVRSIISIHPLPAWADIT